MPTPLQKNRIWLSQGVGEPAFDESGENLFYARSGDGRRNLVRQSLASGLVEAVSAEPAPGGTVGYGGGAFAVWKDRLLYAASGRLISVNLSTGEQRALTPEYEGLAAPAVSPCGRFVAFVIEFEAHAEVCVVDTEGAGLPIKLTQAPAFAANPTFSPDGARIAWMEWDEDRMPWDQCLIRIARLKSPATDCTSTYELMPVSIENTLAASDVSYASPQFSPDGAQLAYTSDESGWRSLYIADATGWGGERVDTGPGEIGEPDWIQGLFAARWGKDRRNVYALRRYRSRADLLRVALPGREVEVLPTEATAMGYFAVCAGDPDLLAYTGSNSKQPSMLYTRYDSGECARASTGVGLNDPAGLVSSEVVEWPTTDGAVIYGVLHRALDREGRCPLLVHIHGGPTSEDTLRWDPQAQYFAGRGWHYLSVNHRGGTGNGRAYQDMLKGNWGVVDVEDARTGAEHMIEQGLADPQRVAITGGSAGGYTTLLALVKDPDFWTAGVSLFGISDLYELKLGSHRFEARYDDYCVGPLSEHAERWVDRSPATHVANIKAPVQLFHGKEDKAVPYQQSVDFANAVNARGGIAELVLYDEEGHGFRMEKNRKDQIEKMEIFLEKYVVNLQGKRPRV